MNIKENIQELRKGISENVKLVCVSKFHSEDIIMEAYDAGERNFGESRVQELVAKYPNLPEDIQWHFIGHLQTNKIKYIAKFVSLIHGVDSFRLLKGIDRHAKRADRVVKCLLQVRIADEDTKYGFTPDELREMLEDKEFLELENVEIAGLMGMATFTDDKEQVRSEFQFLKRLYDEIKEKYFAGKSSFQELSMGMSDDYPIAIEEGSTMIRIGTAIFGKRG